MDRLGGYSAQESEEGPSTSGSGRKRKANGSTDDSPVKVTKLDTAKYVYERLFLQVGHKFLLKKAKFRVKAQISKFMPSVTLGIFTNSTCSSAVSLRLSTPLN